MTWLAALLLATVGTFGIRSGSVRAFEARTMPPVATRMLRHAALAILASLAITSLPEASAPGGFTIPAALGLTGCVLAARRSSNLTVIMAGGITAYAVSGALMG